MVQETTSVEIKSAIKSTCRDFIALKLKMCYYVIYIVKTTNIPFPPMYVEKIFYIVEGTVYMQMSNIYEPCCQTYEVINAFSWGDAPSFEMKGFQPLSSVRK